MNAVADQVSRPEAPTAAVCKPPSREELEAEGDRLYASYVAPLEPEHWGEYAAVSPDGRLIRGATSYEVSRRASEEFGRGNFVFRIGDKTIGRIRSPLRQQDR
jgi:hypothetical protein